MVITSWQSSLDVYVNEVHQDFSFFASSSKSCFVSMKEFIALVATASSTHLAQFLEGYFVVKAIGAEQRCAR